MNPLKGNLKTSDRQQERNGQLLERFLAGDLSAEAVLVEENMGLVRTVVQRFLGRGTEYDDLMQIGTIGMIKAIRSFSPEFGAQFSTYAVPLIVGEIRRHLRDEGPIKISRVYRRQGVALMHEKNRILAEEGRDPGIAELAALCSLSKEEAAVSLDALSPVASLSESIGDEDGGLTLEGTLSDEDSEREMERVCDRVAIAQSIRKLPPLWRKIILLRYFRNRTQQQTAGELGLSQVKISREEKKILQWMRVELGG